MVNSDRLIDGSFLNRSKDAAAFLHQSEHVLLLEILSSFVPQGGQKTLFFVTAYLPEREYFIFQKTLLLDIRLSYFLIVAV